MSRPIQHASGRSVALALLVLGSTIHRAEAQFADGASPPVRTLTVSEPVKATNLNPLGALDPASLNGFKGRPLFAPSRRPPPPRQAVVAAPISVPVEVPPPDLRLVGVVAGADRAVAILRRQMGGPSLNLKVGDTVDAWRVDAISPDRVSLRDGDREKTYRLFSVGGLPSQQPASRISNLPQLGTSGPR